MAAKDAFTTKPSKEEIRQTESTTTQDLEPVHFHLAVNNVPKACECLKDALNSRDVSPVASDTEKPTPALPLRKKCLSLRKPPGLPVPEQVSISAQLEESSRRLVPPRQPTTPPPLTQPAKEGKEKSPLAARKTVQYSPATKKVSTTSSGLGEAGNLIYLMADVASF